MWQEAKRSHLIAYLIHASVVIPDGATVCIPREAKRFERIAVLNAQACNPGEAKSDMQAPAFQLTANRILRILVAAAATMAAMTAMTVAAAMAVALGDIGIVVIAVIVVNAIVNVFCDGGGSSDDGAMAIVATAANISDGGGSCGNGSGQAAAAGAGTAAEKAAEEEKASPLGSQSVLALHLQVLSCKYCPAPANLASMIAFQLSYGWPLLSVTCNSPPVASTLAVPPKSPRSSVWLAAMFRAWSLIPCPVCLYKRDTSRRRALA